MNEDKEITIMKRYMFEQRFPKLETLAIIQINANLLKNKTCDVNEVEDFFVKNKEKLKSYQLSEIYELKIIRMLKIMCYELAHWYDKNRIFFIRVPQTSEICWNDMGRIDETSTFYKNVNKMSKESAMKQACILCLESYVVENYKERNSDMFYRFASFPSQYNNYYRYWYLFPKYSFHQTNYEPYLIESLKMSNEHGCRYFWNKMYKREYHSFMLLQWKFPNLLARAEIIIYCLKMASLKVRRGMIKQHFRQFLEIFCCWPDVYLIKKLLKSVVDSIGTSEFIDFVLYRVLTDTENIPFCINKFKIFHALWFTYNKYYNSKAKEISYKSNFLELIHYLHQKNKFYLIRFTVNSVVYKRIRNHYLKYNARTHSVFKKVRRQSGMNGTIDILKHLKFSDDEIKKLSKLYSLSIVI